MGVNVLTLNKYTIRQEMLQWMYWYAFYLQDSDRFSKSHRWWWRRGHWNYNSWKLRDIL